jgi:hypothetical protein
MMMAPVKMKLTVNDRLILLGVIPLQGDFTTLKIIRNMRDELSFSEEEHKKLNFRQEGEMMFWEEGLEDKEVNFGEKATDIIIDAFKKLNEQKKLRIEQMELYEKFVGG